MRFLDDIVNEFDIALKTLSNKKSGTGRTYPPEPSEKHTEELTPEEQKLSIQIMRVNLAESFAAQALSIMNGKKITSLCVHSGNKKNKTIGIIHIHNILDANIR